MKKKKNIKLKGTTLTEVLVAMVLLGIVMTFTLLVTDSAYEDAPQLIELKAEGLIDKNLKVVKHQKKFVDFEDEQSNLLIKGEFSKTQYGNTVLLICKVYERTSATLLKEEKFLLLDESK